MPTNPRFTDRAGYQLVMAGLLFILVLSSHGIGRAQHFDEAGAEPALGWEADPAGLVGHGARLHYVQGKLNAANGTIVLVHRIKMAKDASWQANSIALIAGSWHVSDANGVVATAAQLHSVLQSVASIEIGGVCRSSLDGPTSYPCGFAVREVDLAGLVDERFAAMEFDDGSGVISAWRPQTPPARSSITARPSAPRFISVRLPRAFLGDVSPALGSHLRFDLRTLSNPLVPSQFDSTSGLVILRGRKENAI